MEANRKRAKIHKLPTEDKTSKIWFDNDTGKLLYDPVGVMNCIPQYLYFTTDEEINHNDWYVDAILNEARKYHSDINHLTKNDRKIIASTDPKLTVKNYLTGVKGRYFDMQPIAQPTQAFIKAYCEQGGIDEVNVEYDVELKSYHIAPYEEWKLKVDPIHNTITTHRIVEKMYSSMEVQEKIIQYITDMNPGLKVNQELNPDWIKKNL